MSVDGATATPTAIRGGSGEGDATNNNDPYRFLSTRLVRELIATDAQIEVERCDVPTSAGRFLEVVAQGLSQPGAALLDAADLRPVASLGFTSEEQALLQQTSSGASAPLARRAAEEGRVLLLGRGSREPLLPSLREVNGNWSGLVLVPLCDRDQCAGILVLASTEVTLPAAFLRSLTPAFRLLTLLLHPGRTGADSAADPTAAPGETERLTVELEELRVQLAEAREQYRQVQEDDSSSQAAQRAEAESLRAKVAELEAALAADDTEQGRVQELEAELAERGQSLEEAERRIERAQREGVDLAARLEEALLACEEAEARAEEATASAALQEALQDPAVQDLREAPEASVSTLGPLETGEVQLGEIAEAAAAAIDESEAIAAEETTLAAEGTVVPDQETGEPDQEEAGGGTLGLWHLDQDPAARAFAGELAERAGAVLWTGEGDPPPAAKNMMVVNLFDPGLSRAFELQGRDVECLAYAYDGESGQGFELGAVGWVRRPLDPADTLERIRARVPRRLGGIVIVSAQLRELAGLRQALAEVDAAGSVACDARQATDLLEIVRRPDAVLIDLTLEGGQGLALARQLRTTPETSDVPLLFLLPESLEGQTLKADAERSGVLGPYGAEEARRLLNGALAQYG